MNSDREQELRDTRFRGKPLADMTRDELQDTCLYLIRIYSASLAARRAPGYKTKAHAALYGTPKK